MTVVAVNVNLVMIPMATPLTTLRPQAVVGQGRALAVPAGSPIAAAPVCPLTGLLAHVRWDVVHLGASTKPRAAPTVAAPVNAWNIATAHANQKHHDADGRGEPRNDAHTGAAVAPADAPLATRPAEDGSSATRERTAPGRGLNMPRRRNA